MKGKRRSIEEKVRILRKADGEMTVLQVCDEYNISEQTFYRWKKELGLLEVKQAKRLKDLEAENKRLKKIVADQVGQAAQFCALFSSTTRPNPQVSRTVHSNTQLDGGPQGNTLTAKLYWAGYENPLIW